MELSVPTCGAQGLSPDGLVVAVAISSEALDKPVRVSQESSKRGKSRVILEVMS